MAGITGGQIFGHNTSRSASALKRERAQVTTRLNSSDSSSSLTGGSPKSSEESSGSRAKRDSFPELQGRKRPETFNGKGSPISKGRRRFVGVRQRPSGRWVSEIKDTTQKIRLWLGTFDTAEDAARAYDEAAWLLRGANTRTNFVVAPSKADNSAEPSKAARLLLLRKNAMIAAAAAAKPSPEKISTQQHEQKKIKSQIAPSLKTRTSESADPEQQTTAMSRHVISPPLSPVMLCQVKPFEHQRPETEHVPGKGAAAATSSSTIPPWSDISSNTSYSSRDHHDIRFDPSSSGTYFGSPRNFRSAVDLRSLQVSESSQPLTALNRTKIMVVESGRCKVDDHMKSQIGAVTSVQEFGESIINNSCRRFPRLAEEMCNKEAGMMLGNQSREKPGYDTDVCEDHIGVHEGSKNCSSKAAGFQFVQSSTQQLEDHQSTIHNSTPLGQEESFDTDISSGLSGLEDVDLGGVDSDFDFSAHISMACGNGDMRGTNNLDCNFLDAGNTDSGDSSDAAATAAGAASSDYPELSFTERMRQMMFGRQLSGGLYAMNGVQECLMLYNSTPAPGYCMSSPSLSLRPSFKKSHQLPMLKSNTTSQGWVHHTVNSKGSSGQFTGIGGGNLLSTGLIMNSNIFSEPPSAFSSSYQQSSNCRRSTNSVVPDHTHGMIGELQQLGMAVEGPSPEALWHSWDLTPLCPVI